MTDMVPKWLDWAQRLQAIAQTGLTFAQSPFDTQRYTAIRELAAEVVAEHTGVSAEVIDANFARETGYATPKVDVRGVVFQDDAILLVREREDGLWTLPGGWADTGEGARDNVTREIREEAGYETIATKLLAVYDRSTQGHPPQLYHVYKMFILCELTGGSPKDSIETTEAAFFREDAIPPLSLERVLPKQIARLFEHHRNPAWPTDFD